MAVEDESDQDGSDRVTVSGERRKWKSWQQQGNCHQQVITDGCGRRK